MLPREHTQLRHLYHRIGKLLKEERLVHSKARDDAPRSLVRVKILVRRQQPLSVHQVNVVLVVEHVRGPDVEDGGVVGIRSGACLFEIVGECFVHCGVLFGIEAIGKCRAVS